MKLSTKAALPLDNDRLFLPKIGLGHVHPKKWFLGWKKSREDEERLLPYKRFGEDEPMSKEEWLEGAHGYPISTMNPIPAQEEEQGKTLSCVRVATLVPETPPRNENEEEYSALAMELLKAELIQTPTGDMFGREASGRIFTRQDVWNYQQCHKLMLVELLALHGALLDEVGDIEDYDESENMQCA